MRNFSSIIIFIIFSYSIFAQENQHICSKSKISHYSKLKKTNEINYPGDSNIDVTYYKLDIALSYSQRLISGNVTIDAKSEISDLNSFSLDLRDNLNVVSIKLGDLKLEFTHSDNLINITLDKNYNEGEDFSILVYYNGTPGSSGFGSFAFTSHNGQPEISTLSEPYGASDWWPCKDTPADKADSADIWITVDKSMIPISNGTLEAVIDNGRTHTYRWKSSYPIAQYLISLAITNYDLYINDYIVAKDTMKLYHYNYPENINDYRIGQLDKTVDMMHVFASKFGPYPFFKEKYGHAEFDWGGAMEHQTCSSMGSYSTGIIAHELGHQWFGDLITCKDWHHIWLNEGFATYSEAVYQEAKFGKSGYINAISGEMSRAKNAYSTLYVQNINSVSEIFNGNRSYAKGSVVVHMLRGVLGTEVFYDVLKAYTSDTTLAYGVATTEDFQEVAERISGQDLDYFFSEWIYGENYPKYTVDWGYSSNGNGTYSVSVGIDQARNKIPKFFTMPIQVRFKTVQGDTTVTLFNNMQNQVFELTLDSQPMNMFFDPDNWILKEVSSITQTDVETLTPFNYNLEQNYPNPFNPTTTIKYELSQPTEVNLKVYDILGNVVATLIENEKKSSGHHSIIFDSGNYNNISTGIYFYKLEAADYVDVKKMLLLK